MAKSCGAEAALEAGMDPHRESKVRQGRFWDLDTLRDSCSNGASCGTAKKPHQNLTLQPFLPQDPAHNQLMSLSCQMNHFIKFPGLTLSAGRERRAEPATRAPSNGSPESAPLWDKPSLFQQSQEFHQLGFSCSISSFRDW